MERDFEKERAELMVGSDHGNDCNCDACVCGGPPYDDEQEGYEPDYFDIIEYD